MLGPLSGQYSLDEGSNRRVQVVELKIRESGFEVTDRGTQIVHIGRNFTPGRMTNLGLRDRETTDFCIGIQATARLLHVTQELPIGSYIEDLYRKVWNKIRPEVDQCLSESLGVIHPEEYDEFRTDIQGPVGELIAEMNSKYVEGTDPGQFGRFTAPLRRGRDLGNLLRKSVWVGGGQVVIRNIEQKLRRLEQANQRPCEVSIEGFFVKPFLFYDQRRARLVKTPDYGILGVQRELKRSYIAADAT